MVLSEHLPNKINADSLMAQIIPFCSKSCRRCLWKRKIQQGSLQRKLSIPSPQRMRFASLKDQLPHQGHSKQSWLKNNSFKSPMLFQFQRVQNGPNFSFFFFKMFCEFLKMDISVKTVIEIFQTGFLVHEKF